MIAAVELRAACAADARGLERLAQRDSATVPSGRLLVADSDGLLLAAVSLDTGEVIADPFAPTSHLLTALEALKARLSTGRRRWARSSQPQPAT